MTHPTTPADTPARPADDGEAGLNTAISALLGWRTVPRGNGFLLVDPDNNERWEGASHIEAECWRVVPKYDSDPAAAFGLMTDVSKQEGVFRVELAYERTTQKYRAVVDMWTYNITVRDEEAERAVALACRDALLALGAAAAAAEGEGVTR